MTAASQVNLPVTVACSAPASAARRAGSSWSDRNAAAPSSGLRAIWPWLPPVVSVLVLGVYLLQVHEARVSAARRIGITLGDLSTTPPGIRLEEVSPEGAGQLVHRLVALLAGAVDLLAQLADLGVLHAGPRVLLGGVVGDAPLGAHEAVRRGLQRVAGLAQARHRRRPTATRLLHTY